MKWDADAGPIANLNGIVGVGLIEIQHSPLLQGRDAAGLAGQPGKFHEMWSRCVDKGSTGKRRCCDFNKLLAQPVGSAGMCLLDDTE